MLDAPAPAPTTSSPARPQSSASNGYLLHGEVHEISGQAAHCDTELLQKLIQRHLNRLERILGAHGGRVVRLLPQGLVARFHSAQAALLGACEMQRHCATIPQLSHLQLALKIGIHRATRRYVSGEQMTPPAEAATSRLIALLARPGIVLSQAAADGLPASLKAKSTRLELAAFAVDWNTLPLYPAARSKTRTNPTPRHKPAAGSRVLLHQCGRSFVFDTSHAVITIGRDASVDVAVSSPEVSRIHARIIYRLGNYVLVDASTNGTYLYPTQGAEIQLRRNMATLAGKGRLAFGAPWTADTSHSFIFEVIRGKHPGKS